MFGVLTDMMRGRPAVYATFSSYDEVAHHSGLERADTLEALRKLDQHFARIARARRFAPRPYKLVVLSDHGQTQGATFKQRNGYDLGDLVERSIEHGHAWPAPPAGTRTTRRSGMRSTRRPEVDAAASRGDVGEEDVAVLASGNLGLIYLMEERRRLTLGGDRGAASRGCSRHSASTPTSASCWSTPAAMARSCWVPKGSHYLLHGRVEGEDPLARVLGQRPRAPAAHRRVRARRRHHGRQLLRP